MTLPYRVGRWRGTGWTVDEHGRVAFEQQETVRSPLQGELMTVEGRPNDPGNPAAALPSRPAGGTTRGTGKALPS